MHQNLRTILKRKGEAKASTLLLVMQESFSLLDIAACHCLDLSSCTCPRESKVQMLECDFLLDQQNERKMVIGSVDKETTCKLTKATDRASKRQNYYDSVLCNKSSAGASGGYNSDTDLDMELSDNQNNDNYDPLSDSYESESETCRNIMKFPMVARE